MTAVSVKLPVLSTAILPNVLAVSSGYSTEMDLALIYENIRRRLRVMDISAHEASRRAGAPDAIRNIHRKLKGDIKGNGINAQTLEALAKALGTTSEELRASPQKIDIQPVAGLRETLLKKIAWLDHERERAMQELAALDEAEGPAVKRRRRAS